MAILRGRPSWRSGTASQNAIGNLTVGLYDHAGLVAGSGLENTVEGTSTGMNYKTTTADKKFMSFYFTSAATSGTARALYLKLYLNSDAGAAGAAASGGEALRAFTTVLTNTPQDTVNGAHLSLSFGSTYGNVTGLGCAVRATLHVPNRSLTGTCTAVNAELFADGSSSAPGGVISCMRLSVAGNGTGITALAQGAYAFHFDAGCVDNTTGVIDGNKSSISAVGAIKIYIDGIGARYVLWGT